MNDFIFQISCPSCETQFEVTDPELIGQIVACPKCGGMIAIEVPNESNAPEPDESVTVPPVIQEELVPPIVQTSVAPSPEVSSEKVPPSVTAVPPVLPEVVVESNAEVDDEETTSNLFQSRLFMMLSGVVCALLVVAIAWFCLLYFGNSKSSSDGDDANITAAETGETPTTLNVDEGTEESAVDGENEDFVIRRDDRELMSDEFDSRGASEIVPNELDGAEDVSDDNAIDEVEDDDVSTDEENISNDELTEQEIPEESVEVEDDKENPISETTDEGLEVDEGAVTEFDEEEFEKANGENTEEDAEAELEDEEEDLGAVASTTDLSLQEALPTLTRKPKEVDIEPRLTLTIRSIEFPKSPSAAIRLVSEFSGIPIEFDLDRFELLRPSLESSLDLTLNDVDVSGVLDELGRLLNWSFRKEKDRIVVEPFGDDEESWVEREFDVADILNAEGALPINLESELDGADSKDSTVALEELIRTLVASDSWEENGGQGTLKCDGAKLVVRQNAQNHKSVETLLEQLRALRKIDSKNQATARTLIPEALGWEKLGAKTSFNLLEPISLQQALGILEKSQKVLILWDDATLNEFGIGRDSTTVARIDSAPLEQVLFDLLEPLKLTFAILGEDLYLITTKEKAESYKTVEIHMFGTTDDVKTMEEARAIAEEMMLVVAPSSWDDEEVELWIDLDSKCWIVRQSQPNQRAIRRWTEEREKKISTGALKSENNKSE